MPSFPVVIIGAARSGTNMLRDALTALPEFTTWPCDEINYIWRHGNVGYPTDEFPPGLARPRVRSYIHSAFRSVQRRQPGAQVVEKTCANSLRVGFVQRVLPDARFVEIVRDGRDVVVSAQARWTAALNLPYLARKARFVPPSDLPYYVIRYAWNRFHRLVSRHRRLAFWGPQFEGLHEALEQHSLAEVCALQWQRCVERSQEDLTRLDSRQIYRLKYEDFVVDPEGQFRSLLEFLGLDQPRDLHGVVGTVTAQSVGRWRQELDAATQASIRRILGDTLSRQNYAA